MYGGDIRLNQRTNTETIIVSNLNQYISHYNHLIHYDVPNLF